MVVSLSHHDAEDAKKIYSYNVRRNPKREDGTMDKGVHSMTIRQGF